MAYWGFINGKAAIYGSGFRAFSAQMPAGSWIASRVIRNLGYT